MTVQEGFEAIATSLPGFEAREPQMDLAAAVEEAISDGHHLMAKAGTGTGKSLGYLVPAILSGQRVVVSTATKALQDQVAKKDLPFLAENLGVGFSYALLKGRSNYLCLKRAAIAEPDRVPNLGRLVAAVEALKDDPDFDGTRDMFGFEVDHAEWSAVCSDSDDCSDLECSKDPGSCWAAAAKQKAAVADVVVVNHALFMTDLMVRDMTDGIASMVGTFDVFVGDEAHEMESVATDTFGANFSEGSILGLTTELSNFGRRHADDSSSLDEAVAMVLTAKQELWSTLKAGRLYRTQLVDTQDVWVGLLGAFEELDTATRRVTTDDAEDKTSAKKRHKQLVRRTSNMASRFGNLLAGLTNPEPDVVAWVEETTHRRFGKTLEVKSAPISVANHLRSMLFDADEECPRCEGSGKTEGNDRGVFSCRVCAGSGHNPMADVVSVLTSATMDFEFLAHRLGVDEAATLDVGSPFDYPVQARLYVPAHLPDPTKEKEKWSAMAIAEMLDLIRHSQGRALVLFTSISEMNNAYDVISDRVPWTCMKQGDAPNAVLAERFKDDIHSVLFATRSFMTGMDFQGEACSLVVVNKCPWPVPVEPMTQARCEAIDRSGGSSFSDYTIPVMQLVLEQAGGRLIRHRNDRGVLAILDSRLATKSYGKRILRALPPMTRVSTLAEVEDFFGQAGDGRG